MSISTAVMTLLLAGCVRAIRPTEPTCATGRLEVPSTAIGQTVIAIASVAFVDVYLKARILMSSKKGPLRLPPRATYCWNLFRLLDLKTCDGQRIGLIHGDCVGPEEGTEYAIVLEQGVWVGQDLTWYVGENQPTCVEALVQADYDGTGGRKPGPVIHFRAHNDGRVEILPTPAKLPDPDSDADSDSDSD